MQNQINGWVLDAFVTPDAILKQGDLIKFDQEDNPLKTAGIVVTADCDLKNKKHAKQVTLVPIVSIKTLMEHYLLLEDCDRKKQDISNYACDLLEINKKQAAEIKIATLLQKIEKSKADCQEISIIAAKIVTDQIESITVQQYKTLMSAINVGLKKPDSLKQQLESRGDLLILPEPSTLGISGNIAWVRHLWQVPLSSIALRTSETNSRPGEKIARLDSPYRYRLTQIMAQVFSDIGPPDMEHPIESTIQTVYDHV